MTTAVEEGIPGVVEAHEAGARAARGVAPRLQIPRLLILLQLLPAEPGVAHGCRNLHLDRPLDVELEVEAEPQHPSELTDLALQPVVPHARTRPAVLSRARGLLPAAAPDPTQRGQCSPCPRCGGRTEGRRPEVPNWSQHRIPSPNRLPISMGTK